MEVAQRSKGSLKGLGRFPVAALVVARLDYSLC